MIPRKPSFRGLLPWLLSACALALALAVAGNDLVTAKAGSQNAPAKPEQTPPVAGRSTQQGPPAGQRGGGDPNRPGQRPDWKPWWQDEIIKKEIGLTADQDRRIQQIWDSTRPELEKYAQELKKQETELQRLMSPEVRADIVTVMMQVDKAEQQRTLANKLQTVMFYRMHRILTPEQDTKLKQIRDSRGGRRGGTR